MQNTIKHFRYSFKIECIADFERFLVALLALPDIAVYALSVSMTWRGGDITVLTSLDLDEFVSFLRNLDDFHLPLRTLEQE